MKIYICLLMLSCALSQPLSDDVVRDKLSMLRSSIAHQLVPRHSASVCQLVRDLFPHFLPGRTDPETDGLTADSFLSRSWQPGAACLQPGASARFEFVRDLLASDCVNKWRFAAVLMTVMPRADLNTVSANSETLLFKLLTATLSDYASEFSPLYLNISIRSTPVVLAHNTAAVLHLVYERLVVPSLRESRPFAQSMNDNLRLFVSWGWILSKSPIQAAQSVAVSASIVASPQQWTLTFFEIFFRTFPDYVRTPRQWLTSEAEAENQLNQCVESLLDDCVADKSAYVGSVLTLFVIRTAGSPSRLATYLMQKRFNWSQTRYRPFGLSVSRAFRNIFNRMFMSGEITQLTILRMMPKMFQSQLLLSLIDLDIPDFPSRESIGSIYYDLLQCNSDSHIFDLIYTPETLIADPVTTAAVMHRIAATLGLWLGVVNTFRTVIGESEDPFSGLSESVLVRRLYTVATDGDVDEIDSEEACLPHKFAQIFFAALTTASELGPAHIGLVRSRRWRWTEANAIALAQAVSGASETALDYEELLLALLESESVTEQLQSPGPTQDAVLELLRRTYLHLSLDSQQRVSDAFPQLVSCV